MSHAFLEGLLSRYSQGIKHLDEPAPSDAQLQQMAAAALRAPDHGELVPWRLCVVRGAAREQLAQLFVEHGRQKGKSEADLHIERGRALRAPVSVAVVARIDMGHPQVPAHEQWMSIGGAVTNFLNAVHALGFAAKMLSGDKARAPHIAQAFCQPGEMLVGWISIGTATRPVSGHKRKDAHEVLHHWPV